MLPRRQRQGFGGEGNPQDSLCASSGAAGGDCGLGGTRHAVARLCLLDVSARFAYHTSAHAYRLICNVAVGSYGGSAGFHTCDAFPALLSYARISNETQQENGVGSHARPWIARSVHLLMHASLWEGAEFAFTRCMAEGDRIGPSCKSLPAAASDGTCSAADVLFMAKELNAIMRTRCL